MTLFYFDIIEICGKNVIYEYSDRILTVGKGCVPDLSIK